jgi:hypothetical protein
MPKQTWVLVSLARKEIAVDKRGRAVTAQSAEKPYSLPPGYDPRKGSWSWEPIYETVVDVKHRGAARYELRESQVARPTRIIAPAKNSPMPDTDYRSAFLENVEFEPMPSPQEERQREAERQKKLQLEAEQKLASRTRLVAAMAAKPTERRGVGRDRLFAALKRFTQEEK